MTARGGEGRSGWGLALRGAGGSNEGLKLQAGAAAGRAWVIAACAEAEHDTGS